MASPLNTNFWSQDDMDYCTGLAGVGLLITPTCPVSDLRDVTLSHAISPDILSRYLLVQGFMDFVATYIHIVYAPVQPGQRPHFFNNLPRNFDDGAHHIVIDISILYYPVNSTKLVRITAITVKGKTNYLTG